MKLIDLLNKIASNEDVPDIKIKICKKEKILHYVGDGKFTFDNCCIYIKTIIHKLNNDLNTEVEVVKEDKKIEYLKKTIRWHDDPMAGTHVTSEYEYSKEKICDKINEVISELNKLKGGK